MEIESMLAEDPAMLRQLMAGLLFMPVESEAAKEYGLGFEGGYERKILILLNVGLEDTTRQLLANILKFCKLDFKDVAILGPELIGGREPAILIRSMRPEKVLAFGETIFYQLPLYTVEFYEGIHVLSCVSLKDLEKNPAAKKELVKGLTELIEIQ